MGNYPKISDAEWEVMEIIWARSPISGNDVANQLSEKHNWHLRTVKTMLGRLARKGALTYQKDKNTYLYSPVIERKNYIKHISQRFIQQLFKGNNSLALTHFVESTDLSAKDIDDLHALLKEKQDRS